MDTLDPKAALATANLILAREGVLDAFGHASVRHPSDPSRFYLARSIAPERVSLSDILEFDLDSQPVAPWALALYSERVIHGAIYQARPDVKAICHHHAPAILPFCLTDLSLRVVTQLGATIGKHVPRWDQRDAFGATNHLVTRPEEAASLARCLGANAMVLMKRHGATVVASDVRELTFRAIYSCRDAELQLRALQHGSVDAFTDEEIELAGKFPVSTLVRAWDYWCARAFVTEKDAR
jgi:HCOMODA/2-hydroxy-3-carboxy-muconic semialdehyde decarboxylase